MILFTMIKNVAQYQAHIKQVISARTTE